jgi:hypothetical protein
MSLDQTIIQHDEAAYDSFCSRLVRCTHLRDGTVKQYTVRSGAEPGKERKAAKFETPLLEPDRAMILTLGRSWCAANSIELAGDKGEGELQFFLRGILRGYISVAPRKMAHVTANIVDQLACVPVVMDSLLAASNVAALASAQQLVVAEESLAARDKECLVFQQQSQVLSYTLSALHKQQSNEVTFTTCTLG